MAVRYIRGVPCYPLPTTTNTDYRWPPKREFHRRTDFYEIPKPVQLYSKEEAKALLKRLYRSRLRSTYDVSYTLPLSKRRSVGGGEDDQIKADDEENQSSNQMRLFKRTYWYDSCPRPRPDLPSAKKVLGRARPEYLVTGLTEYQDRYGRFGLERLLKREAEETSGKRCEVGKEGGVRNRPREEAK